MFGTAVHQAYGRMKITIDGTEYEIPEGQASGGLRAEEIRERAGAHDRPIVYEVTAQGNEIVPNDKPVQVRPGARFGTLERVVAGGRDHRRINGELRLLLAAYGEKRVDWTPSQEWVRILDWALPAGYNCPVTDLLVHVPDHYGLNVPLRESYIDAGIRYRSNDEWIEIPHYFDGAGRYSPRPEIRGKEWRYLCLHMRAWSPSSSLLTYINALYTFLSNPLFPWPVR
jgi:hypothetical protein